MRTGTYFKVALFAGLGIATSLGTSSLLAQFGKSKTSKTLAAAEVSTVKSTERHIVASDPPARTIRQGRSLHGHLDSYEVVTNRNHVAIAGAVTLENPRPETKYLWALVVRDVATKDLVLVNQYDKQIFAMNPVEPTHATFREDIMLDPGRYQVEMRLYQVMAHTDLAKLRERAKDSVGSNPLVALCGTKVIDVVD